MDKQNEFFTVRLWQHDYEYGEKCGKFIFAHDKKSLITGICDSLGNIIHTPVRIDVFKDFYYELYSPLEQPQPLAISVFLDGITLPKLNKRKRDVFCGWTIITRRTGKGPSKYG